MRRVKIIVEGKVQGVFFRQSTLNEAKSLNICGYVKNLRDGNVEVDAQGKPEDIEKLVRWLWQGPPLAKVTNLSISELPLNPDYKDFTITY